MTDERDHSADEEAIVAMLMMRATRSGKKR